MMGHPIELIPKDEGQNLMTARDEATISEGMMTARYQRQPNNKGQSTAEQQVLEDLEAISRTKNLTDKEKVDKVHKLIDVPPKGCGSNKGATSISIITMPLVNNDDFIVPTSAALATATTTSDIYYVPIPPVPSEPTHVTTTTSIRHQQQQQFQSSNRNDNTGSGAFEMNQFHVTMPATDDDAKKLFDTEDIKNLYRTTITATHPQHGNRHRRHRHQVGIGMDGITDTDRRSGIHRNTNVYHNSRMPSSFEPTKWPYETSARSMIPRPTHQYGVGGYVVGSSNSIPVCEHSSYRREGQQNHPFWSVGMPHTSTSSVKAPRRVSGPADEEYQRIKHSPATSIDNSSNSHRHFANSGKI